MPEAFMSDRIGDAGECPRFKILPLGLRIAEHTSSRTNKLWESIPVDIALAKSALAGVARRAVAQLAQDRGGELGASAGTAARIVASRAGLSSFSKQCPGTFSKGLVSPWRLKEIKSCQKSPGIR